MIFCCCFVLFSFIKYSSFSRLDIKGYRKQQQQQIPANTFFFFFQVKKVTVKVQHSLYTLKYYACTKKKKKISKKMFYSIRIITHKTHADNKTKKKPTFYKFPFDYNFWKKTKEFFIFFWLFYFGQPQQQSQFIKITLSTCLIHVRSILTSYLLRSSLSHPPLPNILAAQTVRPNNLILYTSS
jgi:hypothetical protein